MAGKKQTLNQPDLLQVSMHFHLVTDIDGSCMVEAGGTSVLRDGCKGVPENTDPCEETLK